MRALIVDDEPTVRLLLSRILRREVDCVVSEATNGIEALDLLARHHFDFVVMDILMPLMDGIETVEAIRSLPQLQDLPVMVLSAVREESQVRQLVRLGVSAYLTKPLRPSEVSARLHRFVASLDATPRAQTPAVAGRSLAAVPDGAGLLVVDGDADFRRFVRSAMGDQYVITDAESGAHGLRACLDTPPAAVLLGQNLGAVRQQHFLRKLRTLPGVANVPVVILGGQPEAPPPADADAVVSRTLVPETFRDELRQLFTGARSRERLLLARPELRPEMISVTEQVFEMMLGLEVVADPDEPAPPEVGKDLARVLVTLANEDSDLEFGITASRDSSEYMTSRFLQGAEVVTDQDVASTLQELANIITGRLQNALRGRGDDACIGLPVVSTVTADMDLAARWAGVGFTSAPGDLAFTTYVRPVARVAAA